MPGKDPTAAVRAFMKPMQDVASCITSARLSTGKSAHFEPGDSGAIGFYPPTATLAKTREQDVPLHLDVTVGFKLVPILGGGRDEKWDVNTTCYYYQLSTALDEEILGYHWHPDPPNRVRTPHVHVGSSQLGPAARISSKHHLPTGRLAFEELAIMLIEELGVSPRRRNYREVIEPHLEKFKVDRSWP